VVAKLLLENGARLETEDYISRTPLLYAAENGHEAVVKLLMEKGTKKL
jgi:ankyrin repeat protein